MSGSARTTTVLALCCGVTASNVYLLQPIAVVLARHYGVTDHAAGLLASGIQVAYAIGIALFVPIIDHVRARTLLVPLFVASTACLAVMALAPTWQVFAVAAWLMGLVCPIPQIVIPAAVGAVGDAAGARLVGALQAGLLIGLLCARFYAGAIATAVSVSAVFAVSCVLTAAVGMLAVPALHAHHPAPGARALALPGVAFVRGLPLLTRPPRVVVAVCVSGLPLGMAFGMFWNSLTFLATSWYGLTAAEIGLFGLVAGVSGAVSPLAGRVADQVGLRRVQTVSCVLVMIGWLPLLVGERSVVLAVLATVVIDVGAWSNQVINQATIFREPTVPRGLGNTFYFCARFLGISAGSAIGSTLYLAGEWSLAIVVAVAAAVAGLACYLIWVPVETSTA